MANNVPEECCLVDNYQYIVFKDKGNPQKLTLNNKNYLMFKKITVDGCAITAQSHPNQRKCDFMLIIESHPECKEYYVELKGSDIKHAINQIIGTVEILSQVQRLELKKGYVICNRCPAIDTTMQKAISDARKLHNIDLTLKSNTGRGVQFEI